MTAPKYDIAYVRDLHSETLGRHAPVSETGQTQIAETKLQLDKVLGDRTLVLIHSRFATRSAETAMLIAGNYPKRAIVSPLPTGKRKVARLSRIKDPLEWAEARADAEADAVESHLDYVDLFQARDTRIFQAFVMSGRAIAQCLGVKLMWGDDGTLHVPFFQEPIFGEPATPSGEVLIPHGAVLHRGLEPELRILGGTNSQELRRFMLREGVL